MKDLMMALGKMAKHEESESSDSYDSDIQMCAQECMDALKNDDVEGFAEALHNFIELCK